MDPYIGEIAAFALNFVPRGWALCNGAILKIEENPYLFNLIGTRYGGDGVTTFALPDLRSRVVLGQSEHNPVGKIDGSESVELALEGLPRHTHIPNCSTSDQVNSKDATNAVWSASDQHGARYAEPGTAGNFSMNRESIMTEGGGQPHENRMPVLAIVYCIAISGEYPSFG
ncbi:Microcystin-dependent protein [Dyadobacter soli]|uniref:Microcystin-dependent protein n=1 Tax=Dyadobacter soli TaxID=659014 RepID=A0A1G7VW48_9BACT|nr:tail fiber protein [Dyadobacter soli]SDG64014.1 Microcystin-dependent protein [Dyadobacter soli]